jgi:O-antigen/teichoic acid export membrane protein
VVLGNAIYLLLRPAAVLAITGGLLLAGVAISPVSAVAIQLAAGVSILIIALWALWWNLPARTVPARGSYNAVSWLKSAGPLAITAAAVTVTTQTDVLMLGYFQPDEEVGLYRVASQGALLVTFGLQAVNAMLAPEFTRLHAGGDSERLQRLATFSARVVVLVALPIAVAFIAAGDVLAGFVFGSDFVGSHAPLAVLAAGQLVNAAFGSVGMLMNMTRHERDSARAVAVAAVLNVVLNACLIPLFGLVGAAVATAVSVVTWNVILYRGAVLRLGIDSSALGPRKT